MRFSVDYVVPPGAADGVLTLFVDGEPIAEFLDGVPERFAAFIGAWLQTLTEGHRLRILSLRDGVAECSCGRWRVEQVVRDADADSVARQRLLASHREHVQQAPMKREP